MKARFALVLAVSTVLAACRGDDPDVTQPSGAGAPSASAAVAQEELFTIVPAPALTRAQENLLATIRGRPSAGEVHVARVAASPGRSLQHGRAVRVRVAPDRQVVAVGEEAVQRGPDAVSWAGTTQGEPGWVQLVLTERGVTGTVRTASTLYHVEPLGGGLHAISRTEVATLPPEHSPEAPSGASGVERGSGRGQSGGGEGGLVSALSGSQIDLLVVYTASAAGATGDINGLIQLAVDETNTSYTNSGITATVAKAHVAQVTYTESGRSYQQHVDALVGTADGMMDAVHTLRNQYLADVVVLVLNDGAFCGQAGGIKATSTTAFAVVHVGCATGNYSFGHEIGHLQGARHDRAVDNSSTPYQYGHGYVAPTLNWRTVMAYVNACGSCLRVQYWSNPGVTYPPTGQAMGTATYEHDARVLNETQATVAAFRELAVVIGGKQNIARYESAQYTATPASGLGPYTYQWRARQGSPSFWGSWGSWFSTGSQNYTFASISSCGLDRIELQVQATDSRGKVGTSSYLIYLTNPC
ncbi:MAG: M12 family metallo-peptidase [Longimicrobiaceae bacterium]